MWITVGNGYLNLNNVVSAVFTQDDDGTLTATIETFTGHAKHYLGPDARALRKALDSLSAEPAQVE
jgi:hypothetical protein